MIPTEKVATKRIDCANVVLLPYTAALVPVYHQWMQDPELLSLTASEPLTLEQEYANQISWASDPTKYCFIVHSRRPVDRSFREGPGVQTGHGIDYTLHSTQHAADLLVPVEIPDEPEFEREEEEEFEGLDLEDLERARKAVNEDSEEEEEEEEEVDEEIIAGGARSGAAPSVTAAAAESAPASTTDAAAPADAAVTAAAAATSTAAAASAFSSPAASSTTASASTVADDVAGSGASLPPSSSPSASAPTQAPAQASAQADPGSKWPLTPIGDVNLFLHEDFNLGEYGIHGGGCEIEIMIAAPEYRKRGLGSEALRALMRFSAESLGVERFVVKVLRENAASLALFEKKLGFKLVEYVDCFDECVYFLDTSGSHGFATGLDQGEEGELPDDDEGTTTTAAAASVTAAATPSSSADAGASATADAVSDIAEAVTQLGQEEEDKTES